MRPPLASIAILDWRLSSGYCPGALPALTRADQLQPRRVKAQIDRALRAWLEGNPRRAEALIVEARERSAAFGPLWEQQVAWASKLLRSTDLDPPPPVELE